MLIVKLLLGLFFLLISMGYLYYPSFILKFNAWVREILFNDADMLLARKRIGLLFFILSAILLFMSFSSISKRAAFEDGSEYWLISDAQKRYRAREYREVIVHCHEILKRDPKNIYAWELLGLAWIGMGRTDQAKVAWKNLLSIMPNHPVKESKYFKETKKKKQ